MGVETAETMGMIVIVLIVVVVVVVLIMRCVRFAEVPLGQAWQRLDLLAGTTSPGHQRLQEHLHVWADPIEQISRLQLPHVGRPQGVVMRRCAGWQQYRWLVDAILHRGGDQLERFYTGQQVDFLASHCAAGKDEGKGK